MTESAADFRARLIRRTGLSDSVITAAWPDWWSEAADQSPSAQAELRFSLARKLGLDPRSLIADQQPRFVWDDSSRFKSFRGDPEAERPAISSFGASLSRMLVRATEAPAHAQLKTTTAAEIRKTILEVRPHVGLIELLYTCWGMGIPVLHLRIYPLTAKRMSAMSTRVDKRYTILVARDAAYPAFGAFHVAHELGHICLGHIPENGSIVDMDTIDEAGVEGDAEEASADAFAMELLTGSPQPIVEVAGGGKNSRELASQSLAVGKEMRIEPGTLALTYGHATKNWPTALGALQHIYRRPYDTWHAINSIALRNLRLESLTDESESFVRAVMGAVNG